MFVFYLIPNFCCFKMYCSEHSCTFCLLMDWMIFLNPFSESGCVIIFTKLLWTPDLHRSYSIISKSLWNYSIIFIFIVKWIYYIDHLFQNVGSSVFVRHSTILSILSIWHPCYSLSFSQYLYGSDVSDRIWVWLYWVNFFYEHLYPLLLNWVC